MYRDDMEEWAAKSAEARAKMQAQKEGDAHAATSMDDDGGGAESNWGVGAGQDNLFDDIPVGIREFMKTEKKLKHKHNAERAAAG